MALERPPAPEDDTPPTTASNEAASRSHGGDHIDFSGGVFHDRVVGKEEHHHHHAAARVVPLALDAVPAPSGGFVGRQNELTTLSARLDPTRGPESAMADAGAVMISALAGMGGVGKTALALEAAQAASEADWFCAHLFVDLHGYTPHTPALSGVAALDVLLRQMGVDPENIPADLSQRRGFYRSALQSLSRKDDRRRPVLVVADNARTLDQIRPLLPGPGGHRLLFTSRETLALDGHQPLSLDTLPPGEAVALLRSRLGPDDPRAFDTEGLQELAHRCGHLPLALKIAAALLARKTRLAPHRLAARLAELAKFTDPEHNLTAVFDTSLAHLPPEQLRVFALLGSNPGTDISTVAAMCMVEVDLEEVEEILEELAAAHLITSPFPDRWAMHDLLAEYARTLDPPTRGTEKSTDRDGGDAATADPLSHRDRALDRVLEFYTRVTYEASKHLRALTDLTPPQLFSDREHALEWLDDEIDNLLACVRTAHQTHRAQVAIALPSHLDTYLQLRRHFTEAIEVHTLAHESAHQVDDASGEAVAWNHLGNALQETRQFNEAIQALTHARHLYQKTGDDHGEAQVWDNLGNALAEAKRFEEAIEAHMRGLAYSLQTDDLHGQATTWCNLGLTLSQMRRFEEAVEALTHARDLCQQASDTNGVAKAWGNLGLTLQQMGRPDEASVAHEHALGHYQQVGDDHGEATAWNNFGLTLLEAGRFEKAIETLSHACKLFQKTGDKHSEAGAWGNLGMALQEVDRLDEAFAAHARARNLYQLLSDNGGKQMRGATLVSRWGRQAGSRKRSRPSPLPVTFITR